MKKEQMQLAVIAGGVVIFAMVMAGNLKKKPAPAAVPASASAAAPVPQGQPQAETPALRQEQLKRSQLPWKRDPFAGAVSASADLDALKLKGISFGPDGRGFVTINDVILGAGESIADFTVKQIEKDKVLLEKNSQSFYLVFPDEKNP